MKQIEKYQVKLETQEQYDFLCKLLPEKGEYVGKIRYEVVCMSEIWTFFYKENEEWNLRLKKSDLLEPISYTDFIALFEEKRTEFYKGDYIVLLINSENRDYLKDHVYQIREKADYFLSVLDSKSNKENGWYKILYNKQNEYWRYATFSEVEKYLKNQKPVSIVEKVPPRFLVFKYENVSEDIYVDDIVVSLNYVLEARKVGDMFQVLKNSYLGKLSYSQMNSSCKKEEWRLATGLEKIAYEEGIRSIYHMPPHPIPPPKKTEQIYMSKKIEVFDDVYVGDIIYAAEDQPDYDLKKGEPCTVHTESDRKRLVIYKYGKKLGSYWGNMDWFSKTPLPETVHFVTGSISGGGNTSIIQGGGYTVEPSIHARQTKKGFDEAEYQKHPFNQSLIIKTKKRKK